jgi:hypothetical protein
MRELSNVAMLLDVIGRRFEHKDPVKDAVLRLQNSYLFVYGSQNSVEASSQTLLKQHCY